MAFLPTNASQVQQFAVAVYGIKVGTATMAAVQADITNVGGLNNALNNYYATSFGSVPTADVAASIAANLGLTAATGLADVTAYITAQLNAAPAGARGQVVSGILNLFSTLSSNAVIGTAVTAWNTKIASAVAYTGASDAAVSAGSVAEGQVFTLTTGVEDVVGTSGADTIVATVKGTASDASTYETGDNIDGGDGVDTLSMLIVDDADLDDELVALTAVENVVIRSLDDAGGDEVQADFWDGVVRIESNRSTAAVEVVDVQSAATLAVTDSAENLTVTFADDAIGAADATLSVVVDGAGTAAADSVIAVNIGGDDAFTRISQTLRYYQANQRSHYSSATQQTCQTTLGANRACKSEASRHAIHECAISHTC